jgi:hypothetical protein
MSMLLHASPLDNALLSKTTIVCTGTIILSGQILFALSFVYSVATYGHISYIIWHQWTMVIFFFLLYDFGRLKKRGTHMSMVFLIYS